MSKRNWFSRRWRVVCLLLLLLGGVSLNGCIFVEHGGHHHHDWH